MKRYVVFAGDRCYASGGACDYVMDFSKIGEAEAYRNSLVVDRNGNTDTRKWAHVWDTKLHTIYPNEDEDEYGYSSGIA
jgi:hypothetical protein